MTTNENEDRQNLDIDATLTAANGVRIPVTIRLMWPEGYGLHAAQFLSKPDMWVKNASSELMHHLINSGDSSVLAAMARKGYAVEDDE